MLIFIRTERRIPAKISILSLCCSGINFSQFGKTFYNIHFILIIIGLFEWGNSPIWMKKWKLRAEFQTGTIYSWVRVSKPDCWLVHEMLPSFTQRRKTGKIKFRDLFTSRGRTYHSKSNLFWWSVLISQLFANTAAIVTSEEIHI